MLLYIGWEKITKTKSQQRTVTIKAANFNFIFRDEAAAKSLLTDMKRPEFLLLTVPYWIKKCDSSMHLHVLAQSFYYAYKINFKSQEPIKADK